MTTYTVDTDGTSGDYSTFSAAVAALPSTFDDDYTIELYATTVVDDTTNVTYDGDTTSSYRLTIEQKDDNYRLRVNLSSGTGVTIERGDGGTQNVTLKGVHVSGHSNSANYQKVLGLTYCRLGEIIIDSCLLEEDSHAYRSRAITFDLDSDTHSASVIFKNNVIITRSTSTSSANAIAAFTDVTEVLVYNNTWVGNSTGTPCTIYSATSANIANATYVNNLFYLCAQSYGSYDPGTADYNATDGAYDLGGTHDRTSQTFTFDDASSDDYHLDADDEGAIGYGVGPTTDTDVPTLDHDGETRSGTTCDIGAYEYVSGGGTTFNVSVAESLTLTESAGGALVILASVAETMNMSAAAGPTTDIPQTIAESLVLSEASSVNITMPASVAESLLLSDNVSTTAILNVSIAESFILTDSAYTDGAILDLTIAETINLSDVANLVKSVNASIAESFVLTDGASATVNISITIDENLSLIDQIALIGTYNVSISEQLALTDNASSGDLVDGQLRMCITGKSGTITMGGKSASISVTYKTGDITISGSDQDGC